MSELFSTQAFLCRLLRLAFPAETAEEGAHALTERFGTLARVLRASETALCETVGARMTFYLRTGIAAAVRARTDAFVFGRVPTERELLDYFQARFTDAAAERVYAVFFDREHRAVGASKVTEGTINASALFPRIICEQALAHHAAFVALAHNHPGGFAEPSTEDVRVTACARKALDTLHITLTAHYVFSDDSFIDICTYTGSSDCILSGNPVR